MTQSLDARAASKPAKGERPALGKREQNKRENRMTILRAARTVFAELGFEGTTVRDIVRGTGLAAGTFYNYFRTKEEVFEALLDEAASRLRPRLHQVRLDATSFEDFVRATFATFLEDVAADSQMFEMMRRNTGCLRVRMETPEVLAALEDLRSDIDSAIEHGLIPAIDADYLTGAIVGVAFETADRMMRRPAAEVAPAADFATAMILGGVAALSRGKVSASLRAAN